MLEEIKAGLKLCLDLNLQQVIFERDSKVIIDFLSKRNKDPRWHMEGLDFEAVKNPKGEMFQVQHVGKKCKKVADLMANIVIEKGSPKHINLFPSNLKEDGISRDTL
jgi:hypothetical protein